MGKSTFNPSFTLEPNQSKELQELWTTISDLVEPERNTLVMVRLARKSPVFTKRQLYMCAANLVSHRATKEIPEWMHQMIETCRE
jgi:hypothetical protein